MYNLMYYCVFLAIDTKTFFGGSFHNANLISIYIYQILLTLIGKWEYDMMFMISC